MCLDTSTRRRERKEIKERSINSDGEETGTCAICLEEKLSLPVKLDCSHIFCLDCVAVYQQKLWREKCAYAHCPCCREPLPDITEKALWRSSELLNDAEKCVLGSEQWQKYTELALKDINAVLKHEEESVNALALKVRCLTSTDPETAIQLVSKALKIQERNEEFAEEMVALKECLDEPSSDDTIIGQYVANKRMNEIRKQIPDGAYHLEREELFEMKLDKGDAFVYLEKWKEASYVYQDVFKDAGEDACIGQRATVGMCRCLYELGSYDLAIKMGSIVTVCDRTFVGAHKYIALSQKAKGDIDAAIRTMTQGVLYEAPWDQQTRRENLQALSEL